ncbi:hypothetical protein NDU88_005718 [Pleurodeles waltl]|uniref:Uncharacterized protein n=1 Tax=Pleurodeles waltl TaxID=8319 RepID=A0AAV7TY34_PLEWA|nr:hypothetical protein NDU88_005718 [Pleurodeles waltl]
MDVLWTSPSASSRAAKAKTCSTVGLSVSAACVRKPPLFTPAGRWAVQVLHQLHRRRTADGVASGQAPGTYLRLLKTAPHLNCTCRCVGSKKGDKKGWPGAGGSCGVIRRSDLEAAGSWK